MRGRELLVTVIFSQIWARWDIEAINRLYNNKRVRIIKSYQNALFFEL